MTVKVLYINVYMQCSYVHTRQYSDHGVPLITIMTVIILLCHVQTRHSCEDAVTSTFACMHECQYKTHYH